MRTLVILMLVGIQVIASESEIISEPGTVSSDEELNAFLEKELDASGKPFRGRRGSGVLGNISFVVSDMEGNFGKIDLNIVKNDPVVVIRKLLNSHEKRMNAFPSLEIRIREQNEKSIAFEQVIDGLAIDNTIGTMRYLDGVALQFRTIFIDPMQLELPDINVTQASAESVAQQVIEGELALFLEDISFGSLLRYSVKDQEAYWDVKLYRVGNHSNADYGARVNATTSEANSFPTVIDLFIDSE